MALTGLSPWLPWSAPADGHEMRILCFPYAGAGAALYRPWMGATPYQRRIAFCPVELPGRGTRLREAPANNLADLLAQAADQLAPLLADRPFALFGHSMGGLISAHLAGALAERAATPRAVYLSAVPPPHAPRRPPDTSDAALVRRLAELGGTPAEVFDDPVLLGLILPRYRADLLLSHGLPDSRPRLTMPVMTFAGMNDLLAPPPCVREWEAYCAQPCRHIEFPDEHLFLSRRGPEIVGHILSDLEQRVFNRE